jgi:anti-sigma-K factor RskA
MDRKVSGEGDRLTRAGNYVLGLMSEADRERAERDLELDPAFRDAVLSIAERMQALDFAPQKDMAPAERWKLIAERINELPQMRRPTITAGARIGKVDVVAPRLSRAPIESVGVVIALILAGVVGYAAGVMTSWLW